MKTIAPLVALIMLSLSACKKDNRFVLHAEMTGLSDKPILVIYDDPVSRLDTIFPKEGKFEYAFLPDTITIFRLVSTEGEVIPFFADRGQEVKLAGTFGQPDIQGSGDNEAYGTLLKELQTAKRLYIHCTNSRKVYPDASHIVCFCLPHQPILHPGAPTRYGENRPAYRPLGRKHQGQPLA